MTGTYGRSWLNWGNDMITHDGANQDDPLPRESTAEFGWRVVANDFR